MSGRRTGRSSAARWALPLALACAFGLLVLPAGAAPPADQNSVAIVVDESVAPGDGSTATQPAGVGTDEPIGATDAVAVSSPASVPGAESVTIGDNVTVQPPATIVVDESVSPSDAPNIVPPVTIVVDESVSPSDAPDIVPPASVLAAETANVADDVSVVPTSSRTTTTVTAAPNPALFGTAVQLQATVTSGARAVDSGAVTFEDSQTPLGPPVPVDLNGHASLTVSNLSLGSHLIAADYGGGSTFLASSAATSEGIYDYALSAGPDQTVLRGDPATYGLTLSLDAGSVTTGLPSTVPFSVGLLPADASSNAPASIAFPQSADSPTLLTVTVQTGLITLGDSTISFTAGVRSASAGLHVADFSVSLSPPTQTVQAGGTATFTLTTSVVSGSSAADFGTFNVLDSTGTTVGSITVPGTLTITIPTDGSTSAGPHPVTFTTAPVRRSASATFYVNVPPIVSAGGPYAANEGSTLTLHGSATDTAGEGLAYTWTLGGGTAASGPSPPIVLGDGPATQTATLTVCDDHGACASDVTTIAIANVAPTATLQAPSSTPEGSSAAISFSGASDPSEADVAAGLHYAFSCDGASLAAVTYASASAAASTVCRFADGPADVNVRARVIDKDGGFTELTKTVHVTNAVPAARILSPADGSVFRVGTHVALSGSFTDPGVLDTHTGTWKVGGTTLPATIAEHAGAGTASATWTPAAPGFYALSLTVTDNGGGTTTVAGGTLVVFDPAAGSVAGIGAFLDPGHNLVAFAFQARYRDHDSVPSGSVEVHVPHLNLVSTHLDWLVVTAPSFQLQGTGSANGRPGYRFLLTGVTGHPDQLRVQIWSPGSSLVYDSTLRPLPIGDIQIRP